MDIFHPVAGQKVLKLSEKVGVVRAHVSCIKGHEKVMLLHKTQHVFRSFENIGVETYVLADIGHVLDGYDYRTVVNQLLIVFDFVKPAPEHELGREPEGWVKVDQRDCEITGKFNTFQ